MCAGLLYFVYVIFPMKIKTLFLIPAVAALSTISALSSFHQDRAQAQGGSCNNALIEGSYGFQDTGTRKIDGGTVSYTAVRTANFDGTGKHIGTGIVSIDGEQVNYTVTGSYQVNSDCSFSMDATQSYADGRPSQPYKQFGVVVRGGKEIL